MQNEPTTSQAIGHLGVQLCNVCTYLLYDKKFPVPAARWRTRHVANRPRLPPHCSTPPSIHHFLLRNGLPGKLSFCCYVLHTCTSYMSIAGFGRLYRQPPSLFCYEPVQATIDCNRGPHIDPMNMSTTATGHPHRLLKSWHLAICSRCSAHLRRHAPPGPHRRTRSGDYQLCKVPMYSVPRIW